MAGDYAIKSIKIVDFIDNRCGASTIPFWREKREVANVLPVQSLKKIG
jgi:hypothetical protein